jgi:hypothetical protein
MPAMPVTPDRLAVACLSPGVAVDRQARVLRGYVVAQEGHFKTAGRGQFTRASLAKIVSLGAGPRGLKSRFTHPSMSSDGLGSFLGRAHGLRLDGDRVRADLHFDPTASTGPKGDLAGYVMDLAESDPDALSSSLVLATDKVEAVDARGRPALDDKGDPAPPVWLPTKLMASDIVDTGDAVDGLLSHGIDPDGLPLGAFWQGCAMLDTILAGASREAAEARLAAWVERYLLAAYGPPAATRADEIRAKLQAIGTK